MSQAQAQADATRRAERLSAEGAMTPLLSSDEEEAQPSGKDDAKDQESEPEAEGEPPDEAPEAAVSDAGTDVDFSGSYRGTDTVDMRLDGAGPEEQTDPNAVLELEQTDAEVVLTIIDSSNGNDLCTVTADATGASATVRPDQGCFEPERSGVAFVVKSGSLSLDGDRLSVELFGDAEVPALSASGSISYSFEGQR